MLALLDQLTPDAVSLTGDATSMFSAGASALLLYLLRHVTQELRNLRESVEELRKEDRETRDILTSQELRLHKLELAVAQLTPAAGDA